MKTNINITFETLNGHYLTSANTINEDYLCEAITTWAMNTRFLYDMLCSKRSKITSVVFAALMDLANDHLRYDGFQCSSYQIKKWLDTYGNGYDTLQQAVEELNQERSALA